MTTLLSYRLTKKIIDETFDKLDDDLRINIPYTMKMLSYTNFEPFR